jgi:hypothetical protein
MRRARHTLKATPLRLAQPIQPSAKPHLLKAWCVSLLLLPLRLLLSPWFPRSRRLPR